MTIAYFDCYSGAAGDMIVGALIEAGADFNKLRMELSKLSMNREFEVTAKRVTKCGISGTKFDVEVADGPKPHRHLKDIIEIIDNANLPDEPAKLAKRIFTRLARAESQAHNCSMDKVHFHEVGAVDSIVDIVAASLAFDMLNIDKVICSPIALGSGTVKCDHGIMPVPAPATAHLVLEAQTCAGHADGELTTPTGAAILTELASEFGAIPDMQIEKMGYGAGTKDLPNVANMIRVFIGQDSADSNADSVYQLAANLDDTTGELVGYAIDKLLEAGCYDVWARPIVMKKSRPAWELCALVPANKVDAVELEFFKQTTTFGVRRQLLSRTKLNRKIETIETPFGSIRVKIGTHLGEKITVSPEFEDCKLAAESHNVSVRSVMEAAKSAIMETYS